MGSGMFPQGAAAPVMTSETPAGQVSSPPQTAPPQQQTAPQQAGSGMFSQGGSAAVMTYEAPTSQVSSPRVKSPALETENVVESGSASPKVAGRDTAKDDATRNEFKKQVIEAVSHGEDTITIPTKMAIGIIEKGLPEAEKEELKPLKVTKARRTGGCC